MSKLNIKSEMAAIDTRNRKWYDSLTEEEKEKYNKGIWTQQRFLSSSKAFTAGYLEWTNELVNVHFNTLRYHPQLQFQLLQIVAGAAGNGKSQFHEWIAPGKKGTETKLFKFIKENHSHFNDDEVELFISLHDKDQMRSYLEEYGLEKKEITALLK